MRPPDGWRRGLAAAAVALAILGPSVPGRELMPPDEPRFAHVTRDMLRSGDWVLPRYDGAVYLDKPPLLFWLGALFHGGGLPLEIAARLPSLLASVGTAGLLYLAGRRWFDERTGWLAACVFPSSLLVLERGAWASTDALLTALVFAAVVALERAGESGRGGPSLLGGALLGAALLVKGPVALLILGLAIAAGLAPGCAGLRARRVRLLPALLGVALVASPWVAAAALRAGAAGFFSSVWHHSGERFVASWDNIEPWWYQATGLLTGLFPWSLTMLPLAWPPALRRLLSEPRTRWLAGWAASALIVFSIPAGKRGVYLLPLYPALALVVARGVTHLAEARPGRRLAGGLLAGAGVPVALAAGALVFAADGGGLLPAELAGLAPVRRGALALLSALAAALIGGGLAAWRSPRWLPAGPLAFALASGALWPVLLTPAINVAQGGARIGAELEAALGSRQARVSITPNKRDVLVLYGGTGSRVLRTPGQVAEALGRGEPVVGTREELGPPASWPAGTRVLLSGRLGRDEILALEPGEPVRTPPDRAAGAGPDG